MKRALLFLLAVSAFGQIQAQLMSWNTPAAGVAYTGPGDIVSGAKAWWGLRAYNATYATALGASFDWFCSNAGSHSGTVHVTSAGGLNATEIASIASTCAAAQVQLNKLYDQSGSLACGGAACDVSDINAGDNSYIVSCLGSLPCTSGLNTGSGFRQATSVAISQPFTVSGVYARTAAFTSYQVAFDSANDNAFVGNLNSANKARAAGNGAEIDPTMSDSVVHAVQALFNGTGTSSVVNVDGTETTGSTGTSSLSGGFCVGRQGNASTACGGNALQGQLFEIGIWPSAFSSGNRTSVCHNQFIYWGTATSC